MTPGKLRKFQENLLNRHRQQVREAAEVGRAAGGKPPLAPAKDADANALKRHADTEKEDYA